VKTLTANMGTGELLQLYGYEPYDSTTVGERWKELCSPWTFKNSVELGTLRQIMLHIHQDLCPNDERWEK